MTQLTHRILLQGDNEAIAETLLRRGSLIFHPDVRNKPIQDISMVDLRIGLRHLRGGADPRLEQISAIRGKGGVLVINLYSWRPRRGMVALDALELLDEKLKDNGWSMIIYHGVALKWIKDLIDEIITCELIYDLSEPAKPKARVTITSEMKPEGGFINPVVDY